MTGAVAEVGRAFIDQYDAMILAGDMRALYEGGDFYNVGWWGDDMRSLDRACEALVDEHARRVDAVAPDPVLVLDVGCGLGASTAVLARRWPSAWVIGLNVSEVQLRYARPRRPEAGFCVMDASRLAIGDETIDAIVSVEAMLHFPSRERFLSAAWRALRPGGCLVFTDLRVNDPTALGEWQTPGGPAPPNLPAYEALCQAAGFDVIETEDVTARTWAGFCGHLAARPELHAFANRLRDAVGQYALITLRKP